LGGASSAPTSASPTNSEEILTDVLKRRDLWEYIWLVVKAAVKDGIAALYEGIRKKDQELEPLLLFLKPFCGYFHEQKNMEKEHVCEYLVSLICTPLMIILCQDVRQKISDADILSSADLVKKYSVPEPLLFHDFQKSLVDYFGGTYKVSEFGIYLLQKKNRADYENMLFFFYDSIRGNLIEEIIRWPELERYTIQGKNFWDFVCQCISWTDGGKGKIDRFKWLITHPFIKL
jgi:hypothetical protein